MFIEQMKTTILFPNNRGNNNKRKAVRLPWFQGMFLLNNFIKSIEML